MSNSVYCFNKSGEDLGTIGQGLSCYGYAQTLCAKNGATFEPFCSPETLNPVLQQFYTGPAPLSDKLPVLLFLNDNNKLVESDIVALQESIEEYPTTINQNPKDALKAYLSLLVQEKELYLSVEDPAFTGNPDDYCGTSDLK